MKHYYSRWLTATLAVMLLALPACSNSAGTNNNANAVSDGKNATNQGSTEETPTPVEKADPFGKYAEPVSYTTAIGTRPNVKFPEGNSYEDNHATRYLKENYNIETKVIWTAPAENNGLRDRLNLAIASNDIPDIFVVGDLNQLKKLVQNGMIEDVTKVYEDYASPTFKDFHSAAGNKALEDVTFDGKLMAIPNLSVQSEGHDFAWIRQDWLDKLGLQPPKTFEDLTNIARAFKTQDPDGNGKADTAGFIVGNDPRTFNLGFYANKATRLMIQNEQGEVMSGMDTPEYKAGVAQMAELYKEGLIDKEFALKDEAKNNEMIANGKAGIMQWVWWGPYYPLNETMKNDPNADWKPYAILSDDGKWYGTAKQRSWQWVVVKKGFKHPELAMKLVNINEEFELKRIPELTELWEKKVEEGGYNKFLPWPVAAAAKYEDEIERQYKLLKEALDKNDKSTLTEEFQKHFDSIQKFKTDPKNLDNWAAQRAWGDASEILTNTPKAYIEPIYLTTETTTAKSAPLDDLTKKEITAIVMGQKPISAYDEMVKAWKQQGGDQIIKEMTELLKK
ncbi:hypothetical protein SY83_21410 [Paenibacillus swuensis]|uniref:ABC transporter substrate-binding protein n=1 Tax=Paenibacillus swuensis TaxID=1178515 RepID=A0A172TMY7_9BACL|nr:extracellular solute-binding protein [Paenibacillus swuensis]ANE48411.1 hypothetical protein SY83_21410 [Paenibacillus swuensis]